MIAAVMGWIGTLGSISAYVLLSRGRWHANSLRHCALNGLAGLLAGSASAMYGAWPSAVANLLWSLIAAYSAAVTVRRRRLQPVVVHQLPIRDHDPEPPTGPQQVLRAA